MGRSTFEYVDTCCFCLLTLNASITSEKCFSQSSGRRHHHRRDLKSVKSFCSGKIPCTYVPTILLQKNLILESTVFPTHSKTDTPQRVKMFPYVFVFLIVIVFVFVRVFVSLMVSYKEMSSTPTRSLSKRDTSCCASPVAKGAPARDPEVQNILNWATGNIWTSVHSVSSMRTWNQPWWQLWGRGVRKYCEASCQALSKSPIYIFIISNYFVQALPPLQWAACPHWNWNYKCCGVQGGRAHKPTGHSSPKARLLSS